MFHDQDFQVLSDLLPPRAFVIDVGANIGQSIHSIKHACPSAIIQSFEPNPALHGALKLAADKYKDVVMKPFGLGASSAVMTFFVPIVNGIQYMEECTMRLDSLKEPWIVEKFNQRGGDVTFESFNAEILMGDSLLLAPNLIKIDVEGVESEVVAGFRKTIETYKPILLIENGDYWRLHPIIDSLGYSAFMPNEYYTNLIPFDFNKTRTNTFYKYHS